MRQDATADSLNASTAAAVLLFEAVQAARCYLRPFCFAMPPASTLPVMNMWSYAPLTSVNVAP